MITDDTFNFSPELFKKNNFVKNVCFFAYFLWHPYRIFKNMITYTQKSCFSQIYFRIFGAFFQAIWMIFLFFFCGCGADYSAYDHLNHIAIFSLKTNFQNFRHFLKKCFEDGCIVFGHKTCTRNPKIIFCHFLKMSENEWKWVNFKNKLRKNRHSIIIFYSSILLYKYQLNNYF